MKFTSAHESLSFQNFQTAGFLLGRVHVALNCSLLKETGRISFAVAPNDINEHVASHANIEKLRPEMNEVAQGVVTSLTEQGYSCEDKTGNLLFPRFEAKAPVGKSPDGAYADVQKACRKYAPTTQPGRRKGVPQGAGNKDTGQSI